MLEQYSQLTINEWLEEFLKNLKSSNLIMPKKWSYDLSSLVEIIVNKDILLVKWREPKAGDKLKATFTYDDEGGCPFLSLVFDEDNMLQELEIWRGDGVSLTRLPAVTDLKVPLKNL